MIGLKLVVFVVKVLLTARIGSSNKAEQPPLLINATITSIPSIANVGSNIGPHICTFDNTLIKEINLVGVDCTILSINQFDNSKDIIERITIKNTNLRNIPEGFFRRFPKLTKVVFEKNKMLDYLPTCFYELTTLLELKYDYMLIKKIPSNFFTLEKLDVSDNQDPYIIEDLDGFSFLINIISINLSNNHLSIFPLKLLKHTKLIHLDLSRNHISMLPYQIQKLTKLKSLNISYNGFTTLTCVFDILCRSLEYLDISNNSITTLKHLYTSDFYHSRERTRFNTFVYVIKKFLKSNQIRILNLSHNQFYKTDDVFKNLKNFKNMEELNISNNALTTFPKSILSLKKLNSLDISFNLISLLPNKLPQLSNLKTINMSQNNVSNSQQSSQN